MHGKQTKSLTAMIKDAIKRNIYYPLRFTKTKYLKDYKIVKMPKEFQDIYKNLKKESKQITRIFSQDKPPIDILKLFNDLFPNSFFGPYKHKKLFLSIVKLIITSSLHECIFTTDLYYGYDLDKVPWLENVNGNDKIKVFRLGIKIVFDKIVKWLFRKLYYPVIKGRSYEIQFYPRVLWSRFQQRVRNLLVENKWLIPVEYSVDMEQNVRGQLVVIHKSSLEKFDEFRPYVQIDYHRTLNKITNEKRKKINRCIYNYARKLSATPIESFYDYWKIYTERTIGEKLYGAKIDLVDCFGNVNTDTLINIINAADKADIPDSTKKYLVDRIRNQYVRFGRENINGKIRLKIWKWEHGLLQGDRFSAPLCEIYMSYLDRKHLKGYNKKRCFLHRKVDDYFFCSTVESDVTNFIKVLRKYAKINESKTQTNTGESNDYLIEYCGFVINLETRQVMRNFNFKKGTQFHHKTKIWNISKVVAHEGLLAKSVYFPYNNFNFSKATLNLDYNTLETTLNNFFESMVYVAFKFDCTVMAVSRRKPSINLKTQLATYISRTVWYYSLKAEKRLEKDSVKMNVLIKIAYYAFIVVLRRRTNVVYRSIIDDMKGFQEENWIPNFDPTPFKKLPPHFLNISMKRVFSPCS